MDWRMRNASEEKEASPAKEMLMISGITTGRWMPIVEWLTRATLETTVLSSNTAGR